MAAVTKPKGRIEIGSAVVGGSRVPVQVNVEWDRFFESLLLRTGGTVADTIDIAGINESIDALEVSVSSLTASVSTLSDQVTALSTTVTTLTESVTALALQVEALKLPVGALHITVDATDPATTLGYGTWTAFGQGRVLVGVDPTDTDFDTVEETGGSKTAEI